MFLRFLNDRRGGYAIMTALLMVPLLGGLALAIDYSEMSRERQAMLNALDAAGTAAGLRLSAGATDSETRTYALNFFRANLRSAGMSNAGLTVTLPQNTTGIANLKLCASHQYKPYFYPAFLKLLAGQQSGTIPLSACSEVRLRNTIEVALVLDNSGSMQETGNGSGKPRIELLKTAAKELVDKLASQAASMKQVNEPVRFGLVPFAGSVNVGSDNSGESWMDTAGLSKVHHEIFNWTPMTQGLSPYPNRYVEKIGSQWFARGTAWAEHVGKPLSRFVVYSTMRRVKSKTTSGGSSSCTTNGGTWTGGTCYFYDKVADWAGCVEARPHPYNVNDAAPTSSTPATLFVPMFAPDETNRTDSEGRPANNNWWPDLTDVTDTGASKIRQEFTPKYWSTGTDVRPGYGINQGPNISCSTKAITPLTDVGVTAGLNKIKGAIDEMVPGGATNVIEGMAWGWRAVSHALPFAQGRPGTERGNDKVVIVLTDGANTYYAPQTVRAEEYSGSGYRSGGNDNAGNKSIYSAYGYAGITYDGGPGRIFMGTSSKVSKTTFTNDNYTNAMNEHFATLCGNAKAEGIIVMTVSLDLNGGDAKEKAQMDALKACSSDSRFRKNGDGTAAKLYWNTNGGDLSATFKQIADELSNVRIVS